MKAALLVIGKNTDARMDSLINDYAARIRHYTPFEMVVIPELRNTKSLTEEQQKAQEAELIHKQLQAGDHLILLDEHGTERRSMAFATWLEKRMAAEAGACEDKFRIAKLAKAQNLDAIHDTVHEMARDEARHGQGFAGLYKRFFKK